MPRSVYEVWECRTKLTAANSLQSGAEFITTEGYGSQSTVMEPTVCDLYLFGNRGIPDHPFVNANELGLGNNPVCHAIGIDGDAPTVMRCKIYDFRGDAIAISNSSQEFSRQPRIPRVHGNKISHCWTGINAGAVDAQIDGNRIASVRDYGIIDTAGSVQCSNNHVFGAQYGIYFSGGPSRSLGDRFSDAHTGFFVDTDASGSDIVGGTTEHCGVKNMDIRGQRVHIANTRIFVANSSSQNPGIIGCDLYWQGARAVMTDCEVRFPDYTINPMTATNVTGSTGVYVQQHDTRLKNIQLTGSPRDGEIGVRVASGRSRVYIEVDTSGNGAEDSMTTNGFDGTNDRVVKFDDNTTTGIVYVVYEFSEKPVQIPSGWGTGLKIYTRLNTATDWTPLTTGNPYP